MFKIVTIKLIDPKIEDTPDTCRAIIQKSTAKLACTSVVDNGG